MVGSPITHKTAPPIHPSTHAHSVSNNPVNLLPYNSYTALRLSHATPEHLHLTTRGCFIGPIPEGWLRSHRRDWYKSKVGIHYSSRAATFTAAEGTGRHRRVTGLSEGSDRNEHGAGRPAIGGPRAGLSFPQPDDVDEEPIQEEPSSDTVVGEGVQAAAHDKTKGELPTAESPTNGRVHTPTRHALTPPAGRSDDERPKSSISNIPIINGRQPEWTEGDEDETSSIETIRPLREPPLTGLSMSASLRPQRPSAPRMSSSSSSIDRRRKTSMQTSITSSSFVTASEGGSSEDEAFEQTAPLPEGEEDGASAGTPGIAITGGQKKTLQSTAYDRSPDPAAEDAELSNLRSFSLGPEGTSAAASQFSQNRVSSTASLIPHVAAKPSSYPSGNDGTPEEADVGKGSPTVPTTNDTEGAGEISQPHESALGPIKRHVGGAVHFNLPEDSTTRERHVRARIAQLKQRRTFKRLRRGKVHDGEIVKMANMLVRAEFTNYELPDEYDENDSLKIETRIIDKWKEFMVVCREADDDDAPFSLQMYKSRVIPAVEKANKRKHATHEVALNRKTTKVNLFSSLDKTIAIWTPYRKGTLIYTVQAKSGADSMEWYTFLRNVLGLARTSVLQINVPDLNVNIRLDNPFQRLESARTMAQAAEGDDEAILQTMREEQAAASSIIQRCMHMLKKSPEWKSILDAWAGHERIGLAWKRYDRLEWVYGANEQKMYGTIAMEKSHELELRPKQHYPTTVKNKKVENRTEPTPVEGFLVRLTSQRGADQKLGKLFYKRLYFSTHNNYLVFNRPTKADPPAPPESSSLYEHDGIPSAHDIIEETPIIFAINPYPLTSEKQIQWLSPEVHIRADVRNDFDRAAQVESERRLNLILHSDGLVNLCNVAKVREVHRGATAADANLGSGGSSAVDFDQEVEDTFRDDGATTEFDDDRTFELVLRNGLVIRLQAYDKMTKEEWMHRLRALVDYWTLRIRADITLYKAVRAQNLTQLNIDETAEAVLGQFARKWEVTHSYASPELYHACGLARCRSIAMSGSLFRKARAHASFAKELVVLAHGHLLMFQDGLRSRSGSLLRHIHHDRVAALDLRDCYVYSGLVTEAELGSARNTAFEGARPGHHALPRMYPGDGWSSTDEATMTCFVVWHGKRKSWFRSEAEKERTQSDAGGGSGPKGRKRQQLKLVRSLGVPGKSVVFMARSRAERDHWVMNIAMEIERLSGEDDVRLTGNDKDDGE
ncbi:hypothetical protein FH972_021591 [Carpinus fangiana]|uniref:PH domain-containing protein n=1 Tax=Carpinus fangiana TaxID=176857 RepID=A0A5N6KQF1_9ROSI|nr:hypothetical protein FH972_021591 [Carpinus fangiana]